MTLDQAAMDQLVRVMNIENDGSIRRRLFDLGILKGTLMQPVLESPSHNMKAYRVKGTTIALRSDESSKIEIEEAS